MEQRAIYAFSEVLTYKVPRFVKHKKELKHLLITTCNFLVILMFLKVSVSPQDCQFHDGIHFAYCHNLYTSAWHIVGVP